MTTSERFAALVAAEIIVFNLLAAFGASWVEGLLAMGAMAWAWPVQVNK